LSGLLKDGTSSTDPKVNKAPRKNLLSLSGYARPDYKFETGQQTDGGYSSLLQNWRVVQPYTSDPSLTFDVLTPNICDNDSAIHCLNDSDCESGGHCTTAGSSYLNTCRLYPRQDSPRTGEQVVDSCRASGGSNGIYGYCLQPYPRFSESYTLSAYDQYVCKKEPGMTPVSNSSYQCPDGDPATADPRDPLVHRYYDNYCLNWFPGRPTSGGVITAGSTDNYTEYRPPEVLNYCIKTDKKDPSLSVTLANYLTKTVEGTDGSVKSRDSRVVQSGNELKLHDCGDDRGEVKIEGQFASGSTGFPCKKISDYQPVGNASVLLLWDNDFGKNGTSELTEYDDERFYPANTSESIQRRFIKSIDVTFEGLTEHQYSIPNYVQLFPNYDPQTITSSMIANNEYLEGDYAPDRPSNSNSSRGCHYDDSDITKNYGASFLIKPVFTGSNPTDTLKGWTAKMCGWGTHVVALSIEINTQSVITESPSTPIAISYTDTYCSEFVTVSRGKAVVDTQKALGEVAPFTSAAQAIADSAQSFDPKLEQTPYILTNRQQNCNLVSFPTGSLGGGVTGYWEKDGNFSTTPTFTCGQNPLEYNSIIPLSPQIPSLRIKSGSASDPLAGISGNTPFFKIYEYWRWNGSKYALVGDLADSSLSETSKLQSFWNISKGWGAASGNTPKIYGADKTKPDQFIVSVGANNTLSISFFADVKNTQLPLRSYYIYDKRLPNDALLSHTDSGFDGVGIQDKLPPDTPNLAVKPLGQVYTTKYGNQQLYGLGGRTFCVEVRDNWQSCTRTCGTLRKGNIQPDGTFAKDDSGTTYGVPNADFHTDNSCHFKPSS